MFFYIRLLILSLILISFLSNIILAEEKKKEHKISFEQFNMELPWKIKKISLDELIQLVVKNNRQVKSYGYDLKISRSGIKSAEGIYNVSLYSNGGYNYSVGPLPQDNSVIYKMERSYLNTGVSKLLPWGTVLSASVEAVSGKSEWKNYNIAPNKTRYTYLNFSITQPLLKGAGKSFTEAGLNSARELEDAAKFQFNSILSDVLTDTIKTYFMLYKSFIELKIKQFSIKLADDEYKRTLLLIESGRLSEMSELAIKQRKAVVMEGAIITKQYIEQLDNSLKQFIAEKSSPSHEKQVFKPEILPEITDVLPDLNESIKTALNANYSIKLLLKEIDLAKISVNLFANKIKPSIDLTGQFNTFGSDENDLLISMTDASKGEEIGASAFISIKYPLGNDVAEAEYEQASFRLKKAEINFEQTKSLVATTIQSAYIKAESTKQRMDITDLSLDLALKNLEAEQEKLNVGRSTIHQVVDLQEDLENARLNRINAKIEYLIAVLELKKLTGNLLKEFKIKPVH